MSYAQGVQVKEVILTIAYIASLAVLAGGVVYRLRRKCRCENVKTAFIILGAFAPIVIGMGLSALINICIGERLCTVVVFHDMGRSGYRVAEDGLNYGEDGLLESIETIEGEDWHISGNLYALRWDDGTDKEKNESATITFEGEDGIEQYRIKKEDLDIQYTNGEKMELRDVKIGENTYRCIVGEYFLECDDGQVFGTLDVEELERLPADAESEAESAAEMETGAEMAQESDAEAVADPETDTETETESEAL